MLSQKIINYDDLIQRSTTGFVGREWVRNAVDKFLQADGPRSFLILGEPGSGKTSFLASLVRERRYLHHFIGKGSLTEVADSADWSNPVRFAESIGYQLVRDYGGWVMSWEDWGIHVDQHVRDLKGLLTGAKVGKFRATHRPAGRPVLSVQQEVERFGPAAQVIGVYIKKLIVDPDLVDEAVRQLVTVPLQRICERSPDKKIPIVVDGLDEAKESADARANLLNLLPGSESPANVRLILSSRPGDHLTNDFKSNCRVFYLSEDEQGKLDEHALEDARTCVLEQVKADPLRQILAERKVNAGDLAKRVAVASQGNFLYLHHYSRGLRDGDLALLDLTALPPGLPGIYADFLGKIKQRISPEFWDTTYKPLLGILAVARAALTGKQLAAFSGLGLDTVGTLLSSRLKQFIEDAGPDESKVYTLYHKSFGEFLISPKNKDYIDGAKWNAHISDYYWDHFAGQWYACEEYGLRYLPAHLNDAGASERLNELLGTFDWLSAKLDKTDFGEVLADYELTKDAPIALVRGALRLSAFAVAQDKSQMPGQLVGRLAGFSDPKIEKLVAQAKECHVTAWLCPLTPSLPPPGGPLLRTIKGRSGGHAGTVRSIAITTDGRWALTAGNSTNDQTVRVWNLETGDCALTLNGQAEPGDWTPLALSRTGNRAVTAYGDETRVWNLRNPDKPEVLPGQGAAVTCLALSEDEQRIFIGTANGGLRLWSIGAQSALDLPSQGEPILGVAITADGRWGVSVCPSHLAVWDLLQMKEYAQAVFPTGLEGKWNRSQLLALADDGDTVIVGDPPKRWDVARNIVTPLAERNLPPRTLAFTPDGRRALMTYAVWQGTQLSLWDLTTQKQLVVLPHNAQVSTVALSPDATRAVTADFDHDLFIWQLSEPERANQSVPPLDVEFDRFAEQGHVALLKGRGGSSYARSLELEGLVPVDDTIPPPSSAATAGKELVAAVLKRLETQGEVGFWRMPRPLVRVAREGHRAVSVYYDGQKYEDREEPEQGTPSPGFGEITLWDLRGKPSPIPMYGHTRALTALVISPDGRRAVSGGFGRLVRVWDLDKATQLWVLKGHSGPITDIAVTPDGRCAVSTAEDGTVRLWDLDKGSLIATFSCEGFITYCAISPDGQAVIAQQRLTPDLFHLHMLRLCGSGNDAGR